MWVADGCMRHSLSILAAAMEENRDDEPETGGNDDRSAVMRSVKRSLKITLAIFGVLLGGIAITAWLTGDDDDDLPFDYEGFD